MIKYKKNNQINFQEIQQMKSNMLLKNKYHLLQDSSHKHSKKDSYNSIEKKAMDFNDDIPLFPEFENKENIGRQQKSSFYQKNSDLKVRNRSLHIIEQSQHNDSKINLKNQKLKTEIIPFNPSKQSNILQILRKKDLQQKQENLHLDNDNNKKVSQSKIIDKSRPKIIIINKTQSLKPKNENIQKDSFSIGMSKSIIKKEYIRSERMKTQPNNVDNKNSKIKIKNQSKDNLKSKIVRTSYDQNLISKELDNNWCNLDKDTLECTFKPVNFKSFMEEIKQNNIQRQKQRCVKNVPTIAVRNDLWLKKKDEKISQMRREEERQRLKNEQISHRPSIHKLKSGKNDAQMNKFGQEGVKNYVDRLSYTKKKNSAITFKRQQPNKSQKPIHLSKQTKTIQPTKQQNPKQTKTKITSSYDDAIKNINYRLSKMNF